MQQKCSPRDRAAPPRQVSPRPEFSVPMSRPLARPSSRAVTPWAAWSCNGGSHQRSCCVNLYAQPLRCLRRQRERHVHKDLCNTHTRPHEPLPRTRPGDPRPTPAAGYRPARRPCLRTPTRRASLGQARLPSEHAAGSTRPRRHVPDRCGPQPGAGPRAAWLRRRAAAGSSAVCTAASRGPTGP